MIDGRMMIRGRETNKDKDGLCVAKRERQGIGRKN